MPGKLKIGDLELDQERRLLFRGEGEIRLPRLSYDLFLCLVNRAPGIVTTDQLLSDVWGDVVVGEETVKQRISLLRQALGDSRESPLYIESVRGVGYRLLAPVAEATVSHGRLPRLSGALAVGVFLVLALVVWVFQSQTDHSGVGDDTRYRQIAVLPFQDMSAGADQAYFSDGIHEEVITQLSRIAALSVTSRTSVMPYRDAGRNIRDIAAELGVGLIVEGSVRHSDDRVRITVQLIDALKDEHLWAENYDRPLSMADLFDIQSDVAERIAASVETELTAEEIRNLQLVPTDNLQAYELYLIGRYFLFRANAEDLRKAIEYFTAALAEDNRFVEAYVGLGQALTFVGTSYGWMAPSEAFALADENVARALDLRPEFGPAISLQADILTWYHWDWAAAEEAYKEAWTHHEAGRLGHMLLMSVLGRDDEALALTESILQKWPRDLWVRSNAAWRFLGADDPARAISEATVAIEIDSRFGDPYFSRAWAHLALGQVSQALDDFERYTEIQGRSPAALAGLAIALQRNGEQDKSIELLNEVVARSGEQFVPPEEIARMLVALGRTDEAFAQLEAAFDARSRGLIFLHVNDSWDPIRADPRFTALLRRMNLPLL